MECRDCASHPDRAHPTGYERHHFSQWHRHVLGGSHDAPWECHDRGRGYGGDRAHGTHCFGHAIEHVRMLYYTGHTKEEADGCGCKQDDFFTLTVSKMLPLVDQAVEWVKSGKGSAPIHWPDNFSPQGKFTSCLLLKYPRAQWWASYQQGTGGDASMGINADPHNYWLLMARSAVPGAPSKLQIITPKEEMPLVPSEDLGLPIDFESTLTACAQWSKADVLERIGPVKPDLDASTPKWITECIKEHSGNRAARRDICNPFSLWCGDTPLEHPTDWLSDFFCNTLFFAFLTPLLYALGLGLNMLIIGKHYIMQESVKRVLVYASLTLGSELELACEKSDTSCHNFVPHSLKSFLSSATIPSSSLVAPIL